MGSRGAVIPFFLSQKEVLPITDVRMTRFMITLEEGVDLVWHALEDMVGGEIYVKKIPSMKITDIALAVAPEKMHKVIGIRPGEKLHEQMIGFEDAPHTYEYSDHFKILPAIHEWAIDPRRIKNGKKVDDDFIYSSDNNPQWMSIENLRSWIQSHVDKIGKI
jgi:FlaA1/EpsC-like NDP-sugar epimerase